MSWMGILDGLVALLLANMFAVAYIMSLVTIGSGVGSIL